MRTYQLDSSITTNIQGLQRDSRKVPLNGNSLLQKNTSIEYERYVIIFPNSSVQIGLVIGRNGVGQRDLVFTLLEMPNDKVASDAQVTIKSAMMALLCAGSFKYKSALPNIPTRHVDSHLCVSIFL
jgi:hypothetical protein